jgi:molybdopterin molybdotransferase
MQVIHDVVRPVGRTTTVGLESSAGLALAEPVIAAEPYPRFDNSAVDGYAVGFAEDSAAGSRLKLKGIASAGGGLAAPIERGHAVRILTGAPTPPHAFGIAMQEDVELSDGTVVLRQEIRQHDFIRRQGAEFDAGTELAGIGTVIGPGVAAQLAFVGMIEPSVFLAPRVTVIATGDELVDPSTIPTESQIRDTNSRMLGFQVASVTRTLPNAVRVADTRALLRAAAQKAAAESDLILISGGASVGDRDYVASVIADLGVVHFHGVSIRPGKPTLFGCIGACTVFGLPGNPASAFVCFEIFVLEALRRLAGWATPEIHWTKAQVAFAHRASGREDFVRVCWRDGALVEAGEQGSFGINSLAKADALVRLPADRDTLAGEICPVYWLK